MTLAWGTLLGIGLLLVASPLLWPSRPGAPPRQRSRFSERLRERLVQAGLPRVSVPTVLVVSVVLAIACGAVVLALIPVIALALAAALAGLALPTAAVIWRARAGRKAARVVWPDVVDHLVSAIRSGAALPDSVVSLASSGPIVTREAFAEFERDYRATGNFGYCVDTLKSSLADPFADRLLETLRMAREVGGSDLTVVLRSLSSWLRQDAAVRAEVEAKQSWVVNAARLGVAAPWIVLVLISTRPEAAQAFNTAAGTVVILGGLTVSVLAYRVMLALGRLPEERRWFQ